MHPRPRNEYAAILLASYVIGSSVMGLAKAIQFAGAQMFAQVWGSSAAADFVFVIGMACVGWGAFELARRERWVLSALGAWVATWLVYALTFTLAAPGLDIHKTWGESWAFTGQWGWPGLVYSTVVPIGLVLVMQYRSTRRGAAAEASHPNQGP